MSASIMDATKKYFVTNIEFTAMFKEWQNRHRQDPEILAKLVLSQYPVAIKAANYYARIRPEAQMFEELLTCGKIVIMKALPVYDPEINPCFSGFIKPRVWQRAWDCFHQAIYGYLHHGGNHRFIKGEREKIKPCLRLDIDIDDPDFNKVNEYINAACHSSFLEESMVEEDSRRAVDNILSLDIIRKDEKRALIHHYVNQGSWVEYSEITGLSMKQIDNLRERAFRKLRKNLVLGENGAILKVDDKEINKPIPIIV